MTEILSAFTKTWFPYDRWRSFTIAGIASKLFSVRSDHMETKFSFLPAITNDPSDCQVAGVESESISAIVTIVKDRQRLQRSKRSQRPYGNQRIAIATILKIAAIVRVLRSQRSQRFYGNQSSAIVTIPAIVTIVSDHMETESGLYFGKGSEKFHYVFTFRFRNYFLGANVPPEINALEEMEISAKINFI